MNRLRKLRGDSRGDSRGGSRGGSRIERGPIFPSILLVAVVLTATWMSYASGGTYVSGWAPVAFYLAALALIISIDGAFRGMKSRWSIAALVLFAAYTAWTFASLLWSPNRGDAWLGAGQTLLYLLAFWVALMLVASGASRRWLLAASAIGPAIVAALTLLILVPRFEDLFTVTNQVMDAAEYRLTGTIGSGAGEAAFLLFPFWAAVYLAGSRQANPFLRGLVLAGAVLSLELSILTQSRGSMVALSVSLPIFFLISGQRLRGLIALIPVGGALLLAFPELNEVFLTGVTQESATVASIEAVLPTVWATAAGAGLYGLVWGLIDQKWKPQRNVTRVAGGAALAITLVFLVAGATVAVERVGNPIAWGEQKWEDFKTEVYKPEQGQSRYSSISGGGRPLLWQVAWEDFATHPVLGVGTQNYEATLYQQREQWTGYERQPHSLPLEVLAERGAIGGILFFGLLATCLMAGLWRRFSDLASEGKAQVGAMIAAITYWFVYSSTEWFWQMPATTLPAVVYLAMLAGPWQRVEAEPLRWPLRAVGAGVALLAAAAVAPLYIANYYVHQSYASTNPREALAAVERAQRFNPVSPDYFEREAELAMESGDWDRVENGYRNAIALNPEHHRPYRLLAVSYEQRGDLDRALSYYQEALALNPLDPFLNRDVIELLAQESAQQSAQVRFLSGSTELGRLNLRMVNSASERNLGLQGSATLPPDTGVLFVWPADIIEPGWLNKITIPSDVAFIQFQGKINEIKSMTSTDEVRAEPQKPYRLAIVAEPGFFERNNIRPENQAVFAVSP